MDPVAAVLVLLNKEFVVILLGFSCIAYQYRCILYRLFDTATPNIHSAARHMIARTHAPYLLIQLGAPIAGVDNDGPLSLPKGLQPHTNPLHILDCYMTWNVIHFRVITLCELPELFSWPEPLLFCTTRIHKIIEKTKCLLDYFLTKTDSLLYSRSEFYCKAKGGDDAVEGRYFRLCASSFDA